jgi:tRNA nucleotidyltransferase/poly(A) polymerase
MVEAKGNEIKLTEKEAKLFDTLLTIVKAKNLKTTLRVAGGWVRDKVSCM